MTTFERFEREIPELMAELAPPRVPDYFDDMLQQAARTRQRPAWSALERWIPMGVIARTQPMRPLPWRPIAIVVIVALLTLAVSALLLVGATPRLPAPFGLARNGSIVFGTTDGEIAVADAATGGVSTLVAGPDEDSNPWFSNDGTRFAFDRFVPRVGYALTIANADGSEMHRLLPPAATILSFDWSQTGDRIVLVRDGDPRGLVTVVDASNGELASFSLDMDIIGATWRPNHDELLITGETDGPDGKIRGFYLVAADGTDLRPIVASPIVINAPTVSADGTKIAYSTWETGAEGRTHIIDIDSRKDAGVDLGIASPYTDLTPIFSPDATRLMVERNEGTSYRLMVMAVDGSGEPVPLGLPRPEGTNGARAAFSPDGTQVLATFQLDGSTWVFDAATGEGRQMSWPIPMGSSATWQRLAP